MWVSYRLRYYDQDGDHQIRERHFFTSLRMDQGGRRSPDHEYTTVDLTCTALDPDRWILEFFANVHCVVTAPGGRWRASINIGSTAIPSISYIICCVEYTYGGAIVAMFKHNGHFDTYNRAPLAVESMDMQVEMVRAPGILPEGAVEPTLERSRRVMQLLLTVIEREYEI